MGTIEGAYLIDPDFSLPPSLLPPIGMFKTRKNLFLQTSLGTIDVAVGILPLLEAPGRSKVQGERVDLEMNLMQAGTLQAYIVGLFSIYRAPHSSNQYTAGSARRPFRLTAYSFCGTITIFIPRSFQGLVTMQSSLGTCDLSPEVAATATSINEEGGKKVCFIGNLPQSGWLDSLRKWQGDELILTAKIGSVFVAYT